MYQNQEKEKEVECLTEDDSFYLLEVEQIQIKILNDLGLHPHKEGTLMCKLGINIAEINRGLFHTALPQKNDTPLTIKTLIRETISVQRKMSPSLCGIL